MTPRLQRYRVYGKMTSGKAIAILVSVALLAVFISLGVWQLIRIVSETREERDLYRNLIEKAGRRNNVDPDLIRAVIWRESDFDRTVIGSKGEIGLMQVMPGAAMADWAKAKHKELPSKAALANPELNIEIGSWYIGRALRHWEKYKEREALALCEYNAGRSRANAWKPEKLNGSVQDRIKIESTRKYVSDILRKYYEYRKETAKLKQKAKEKARKR